MNGSSLLGSDEAAVEVIYREALYLDTREWDAWLGLYDEHAVFWVPTWRSEDELSDDPDREVSFIYHPSRVGLEERVARLRTEQSVVTMPLARTSHLVGNVHVTERSADAVELSASFHTSIYHPATAAVQTLFGRYEHRLRRSADRWHIARKKILLMNDRVPGLLEFFCL